MKGWYFACLWQHPYVYLVLIFEAFATFVGQLSVLSLIALFGAATTAMVCNCSSFESSALSNATDDFCVSLAVQIDEFASAYLSEE